MKTYEEIILDLKKDGKIKVMPEAQLNEAKTVYIEKMKGYRQDFERKQIQSQQVVSGIILNA